MAAVNNSKLHAAFVKLSDLKMWFKNQSGLSLTMADVPEIISLRWSFFRDRWEFIRGDLLDLVADYEFPDLLLTQIEDFSNFIERQRNSQNKSINPFASSDTHHNYYALWDNIALAAIPINRQEQKLIEDRVRRVNRFTKTDFVGIRSALVAARDEIADVIGLSDPDYNLAFDRSPVRQLRTPKITDIVNVQTLHSGIRDVDFILANINFLETTTVDPFALARANAKNNEVEIQTGRSGRLVKMFYGDSLESLAARYLGDPDRWIEIAIANGLKAPYIDEIGEAIYLISNGKDNQISIAATDAQAQKNIDKLYINQVVFLQSNTVKFPEQRTVLNIKEIPVSGEIVIELSGNTDLDKFKINEDANIRIFKPNTINSNFLVMIPSDQPLSTQQVGETPFFLLSKSEDEKRSGIDLAVNDSGDLIFTPSNDFQLSFGLANALQAVKFKMISEQGQNPRHPNYGLPSVAGTKVDDPEAIRQTLVTGVNDLIEADSRFDRIEQLDVRIEAGNTVVIGLVVRMAGTGTLVPISFTINTG